MQCQKVAVRCCNKNLPYSSKLVQVSALQVLCAEFIVHLLFNVNCQAHWWNFTSASACKSHVQHQYAVVGSHVPERYTQSKCAGDSQRTGLKILTHALTRLKKLIAFELWFLISKVKVITRPVNLFTHFLVLHWGFLVFIDFWFWCCALS